MNNYEKISSMTVDELAEYLNDRWTYDDDPSIEWWNRKYCSICEPIIEHVTMCDYETEMGFSYCELNNGKCKFFPELEEIPDSKQIMELWLEAEIEE